MMNVFLKPEIANSYDAYYQSDFGKKVDRLEQEIISSLIKDIPGTEMLELGCGTGHWSHFFTQKGFRVTGIDTSEAMLNIAKSKHVDTEFLIADAEDLPFDDASFPVVSSITMLEFVRNREKVMEEIYRVLKKDGWLILGCLNADSVLGKNREQDEVFKLAHFLNMDDLKFMLKKTGTPIFKSGVYMKPDYTIVDDKNNDQNIAPVFIGVVVQKINHDSYSRIKLLSSR